ncbi:MAG: hypothetical protein JW798_04880 [Prolixibacteraceae bacterium]|nr:hypothetical protein [Prolixibacteraceae bacterium]
MKLNEKLYVIEKMTKLIKHEITGNANEFSQKLGISRSQLFVEFEEFKSRDVAISFDRSINSFVFSGAKRMEFREPILIVDNSDLTRINGGFSQKNRSVHFSERYSANLVAENSH